MRSLANGSGMRRGHLGQSAPRTVPTPKVHSLSTAGIASCDVAVREDVNLTVGPRVVAPHHAQDFVEVIDCAAQVSKGPLESGGDDKVRNLPN